MSQHPLYSTLKSWFSSTTWMHYLLVLNLTNPTCAHSFAVAFHFSNLSDCLTQHQVCHLAALLVFSKTPSPAAVSNCFTAFFCSSLSRVSLTLIFLYHLKVQLPAPCLGSLSILTWFFLPEGIPVTTLIFMLQINSLLSPISSSSS